MLRSEKNEILAFTIFHKTRGQPGITVAFPEGGMFLPDQAHHLACVEHVVNRNQGRRQRAAEQARNQIAREHETNPQTIVRKLSVRINGSRHVPLAPSVSDRRTVLCDGAVHKLVAGHVLEVLHEVPHIQEGVVVDFDDIDRVRAVSDHPAEEQVEVVSEVSVVLHERPLDDVTKDFGLPPDVGDELRVLRSRLPEAEDGAQLPAVDVV